jgi:LysM repeat protein
MKLPSETRNRRRSKPSVWNKITARFSPNHRLSANVTSEEDWEVDVPQVRMSRAFAVMLALHIVAIGGLFAFHIWGKEEATEAAVAIQPEASPNQAPTTIEPEAAVPLVNLPEMTEPEAHQAYAWRSGDTKQLVAARYGISVALLEQANTDKAFAPGVTLTIPPAPRIIAAASDEAAAALLEPVTEIYSPAPIPTPELVSNETPVENTAPVATTTEAPAPAPVVAKVPAATRDRNVVNTTPPAPIEKTKPIPAKPAPRLGRKSHVVAKGDTIYNIAKRHEVAPADVMKANGLRDERISLGTVLTIPVRK